jgi:hypothetical protein
MVAQRIFSTPTTIACACALVLGIVLAVSLGDRACHAPVDISGTTRLPAWLVALKEQDAFAYPAHELIGTLLNNAGCSPVAAGLQWIKAGAHARTEQQATQAERGLSVARSRDSQPTTFDAILCAYLANGFANPQQEAITQQAGLSCAEVDAVGPV